VPSVCLLICASLQHINFLFWSLHFLLGVGVGKSTVAAQLAIALARRGHKVHFFVAWDLFIFCPFHADPLEQTKTTKVGLLDVDICGPSIPRLMGVEGSQITNESYGWIPIVWVSFFFFSVFFLQ
jgi:hypothetical protein